MKAREKQPLLHSVAKAYGDDAFEVTRPWENQQDFNILFYIQTITSYRTF